MQRFALQVKLRAALRYLLAEGEALPLTELRALVVPEGEALPVAQRHAPVAQRHAPVVVGERACSVCPLARSVIVDAGGQQLRTLTLRPALLIC